MYGTVSARRARPFFALSEYLAMVFVLLLTASHRLLFTMRIQAARSLSIPILAEGDATFDGVRRFTHRCQASPLPVKHLEGRTRLEGEIFLGWFVLVPE